MFRKPRRFLLDGVLLWCRYWSYWWQNMELEGLSITIWSSCFVNSIVRRLNLVWTVHFCYLYCNPRGQGTVKLHTVWMHKQILLLHKQFIHLNGKIRWHVNVRKVLGKREGAVRKLWAKECAEVWVPRLSQHHWMIHRYQTCRIYLKEGSTVTRRVIADNLFPVSSARQTLVFSSLLSDNRLSV